MNSHKRAKRGDCGGWSHQSTRSNTRFLYSVDERQLTGHGFGITLTLRDCPETHADWHAMRNAYIRRLRRLGLIRLHWLTEWQRRGVPHLHAAVWFPDEQKDLPTLPRPLPTLLTEHWLEVAAAYGAGPQGQRVTPITDSVGWFQYLSKHAVRGLSHYQRSPEGIPAGWEKTGRMWGHVGDWPTRDGIRIELDSAGFFAFRRIVQRWRYADARASGDRRRIRAAQVMLQSGHEATSRVRGVSEWIGETEQNQILVHLAASGYSVTS